MVREVSEAANGRRLLVLVMMAVQRRLSVGQIGGTYDSSFGFVRLQRDSIAFASRHTRIRDTVSGVWRTA